MALRMLAMSVCSFILGAALSSNNAPPKSLAKEVITTNLDNRDADREALHAHIDTIFKAFIERDCMTIRATHAPNWIGFTIGATSILRGLEQYMENGARICQPGANRDGGPSSYKITEIDYQFYGDTALVPYVADVTYGRTNPAPSKLRSLDVYAKVNGHWNQVGSNIGWHPSTIQDRLRHADDFRELTAAERQQLMSDREAVWRAYFSNDVALLEKYVPPETIAINAASDSWAKQADVLTGAANFVKAGGKLVSLEFPRTEIQVFGNVVILYTEYRAELTVKEKQIHRSGRATEIFVKRNGIFVNVGWHLDSGKS